MELRIDRDVYVSSMQLQTIALYTVPVMLLQCSQQNDDDGDNIDQITVQPERTPNYDRHRDKYGKWGRGGSGQKDLHTASMQDGAFRGGRSRARKPPLLPEQ